MRNARSLWKPNQSELGSQSPVAFWEQEVPGSNPGAPTGEFRRKYEGANPWRQVAFEEVLGILQSWIGHVVHASIENPLPVSFLGAIGVMRAAKDITEDYDLDQYDFELHPNDSWSGFALHRSFFLQALWDGARKLSLWLGEPDSTTNAEPPSRS